MYSIKWHRSTWLLLLLGILLRAVALSHPLADAHLIRQCQTAAATESLLREPGFHLSYQIPWLGNLDAHYLLELPLYNYLVIGLHALLPDLTFCGKLASILLWILSLFILQFIWRRLLTAKATFWANFLFVTAPLSVFFGQAFMPEMLIQLLALLFIWQVLRYDESQSLIRWLSVATIGLLGLLTKFPEISHLYLLLLYILTRKEKWGILTRSRYLLSGILTILVLLWWGRFVNGVNAEYLPQWESAASLKGFIGPLSSRFQARPWAMALLYVLGFILPGLNAIPAALGVGIVCRQRCLDDLSVWLIALLFFYLLWFGNAGTAQSYYNLPAVGPLAAVFGVGMARIQEAKFFTRWPRACLLSGIVLAWLPAFPAYSYLFKQDQVLVAVTQWAKANTKPTDLLLFRLNHRFDMIDYPYNAVPAYLTGRSTFLWANATAAEIKQTGLRRSQFAIITLPPRSITDFLSPLRRFRGLRVPRTESTAWLQDAGYYPIFKQPEFLVFEHRRDGS